MQCTATVLRRRCARQNIFSIQCLAGTAKPILLTQILIIMTPLSPPCLLIEFVSLHNLVSALYSQQTLTTVGGPLILPHDR